MKIKMLTAAAVLVSIPLMADTAEAGGLGCLLGGGAGGFGGSKIGKGSGKTIATIAGALLGCGVGSRVQDNNAAANQQRTQPQIQWNNNTNAQYAANGWTKSQPTSAYWPQQPQPTQRTQVATVQCASGYTREYNTTVIVGGEEVPAYGTACYKADGSWELGPATTVQ